VGVCHDVNSWASVNNTTKIISRLLEAGEKTIKTGWSNLCMHGNSLKMEY